MFGLRLILLVLGFRVIVSLPLGFLNILVFVFGLAVNIAGNCPQEAVASHSDLVVDTLTSLTINIHRMYFSLLPILAIDMQPFSFIMQ